mmetsp:Transcript_86542/g.242361  ORF Transcript_86542/g.242361 Transcript_86542/m.242361 type:complete len:362 (-) Transcript_86542:192-1277(-)
MDELIDGRRFAGRLRAAREQDEGNSKDSLDAIAQNDVPNAAKGLALEDRREEAKEPLRAHEEQLEVVELECFVKVRQPLAHQFLQYGGVCPKLTHAINVPTAVAQLHQQLPHTAKRCALVVEYHDEHGGDEVERLAIAKLRISASEAAQQAPQRRGATDILEGNARRKGPLHVGFNEVPQTRRQMFVLRPPELLTSGAIDFCILRRIWRQLTHLQFYLCVLLRRPNHFCSVGRIVSSLPGIKSGAIVTHNVGDCTCVDPQAVEPHLGPQRWIRAVPPQQFRQRPRISQAWVCRAVHRPRFAEGRRSCGSPEDLLPKATMCWGSAAVAVCLEGSARTPQRRLPRRAPNLGVEPSGRRALRQG